jgi:hypothetical protein
MTPSPEITAYVVKLRRMLRVLPEDDRRDIAEEIRAHLEASAANGTLDAALKGLGPPEHLARQYVDELRLEEAYVHGGHGRTLATLATLASRRLIAVIGLFITFVFYVAAFGFIATAIADLFFPDAIGLWTGSSNSGEWSMHFGTVQASQEDWTRPPVEHLGRWYPLVSGALGIVSFIVAQAIGQLCIRLMRRPTLRRSK